jgi:hypothetical protein
MKKGFKIFCALVVFALVMLVPSVIFAQDSTVVSPVVDGSVTDFFSFLLSFIPVKYQATVLTIVTGLFLLEQFLAATSKIKANSTFQLIAGWITSIKNSFTKK